MKTVWLFFPFLLFLGCDPAKTFMEEVVVEKYGHPEHGWHKASGGSIPNPVAVDERSLRSGKNLFGSLCAPCHGTMADGRDKTITGLNPEPANLVRSAKKYDDHFLYLQISLGRDGMPIWRKELTERDRWDIVNYVKSL